MPSTRVVFTLPNSGSCVPGMGYEKTSCGHEIPADDADGGGMERIVALAAERLP